MKKILLLGIVTLTVSSCYYDNGTELYPTDPNACQTTGLTYDANIKAIFSNNCSVSGCHSAGAQLPTLETYSDVKDNLTRIEFRALIEKSMPPAGPLSSCEQSQLTQWIADGAPQN